MTTRNPSGSERARNSRIAAADGGSLLPARATRPARRQQIERHMSDPVFFRRKGPFTAAELAEWIGARIGGAGDGSREVHDIAPLDTAQKDDLAYFENPAYLEQLSTTRA